MASKKRPAKKRAKAKAKTRQLAWSLEGPPAVLAAAMTTLADTAVVYERVADALERIASKLEEGGSFLVVPRGGGSLARPTAPDEPEAPPDSEPEGGCGFTPTGPDE